MNRPFPIFVDLATVPPLVIGNADILAAKLRLVLKFAPLAELITDRPDPSHLLVNPAVRQLSGVTCNAAADQIKGRPLVIIETCDPQLNARLARTARRFGVPVNVPDNIMLSSFHLGALVDRSPVTVAVSTAGLAPVLGQNLRARLEDMLPATFGDLAHYLNGLRTRLGGLPDAVRRNIQHQILDGPIAQDVMDGESEKADAALLPLIRQAKTDMLKRGMIDIIMLAQTSSSMPAAIARAIRSADSIFYDDDVPIQFLDIARREADLVALPTGYNRVDHPAAALARLVAAAKADKHVLRLMGGDDPWLCKALCNCGHRVRIIGHDGRIHYSYTPAQDLISPQTQHKSDGHKGQKLASHARGR